MLNIENLTYCYPKNSHPVINDLSLQLEPGGIYGILGPNGAGKSTLLYLICGLLTPKSGCVKFNGINTRLRKTNTLADIFLVPEEFFLPNIKLSKYAEIQSKFYPNFSMDDMQSNLLRFGFDRDMNLGTLSMGQKKKVYMCVALAANTPLLLMDEPTNGLDIPGKHNFRSFIAANMTDERTILISTHQVKDVSQLLDNVIIINDNQLLLKASLLDISQRLLFTTTSDPQVIEDVLYAQPDLQGTRIVTLNKYGGETEVDLEMLFQLATNRPDKIKELF